MNSKVYYRNSDIVARKIHGSFFLIDICDNYSGDRCSLYEINETGMFIWEQINGKKIVGFLLRFLLTYVFSDIRRFTV